MRIEWIEKYMADAEKLIYENQLTEGLALLDELLYEEPGYGSLHNHIGWAYMYYTADIEKAELHLKMAIRFDATFAAPYLHMGNLYIRIGRYADALLYLEKGVVASNPNKVAFMESIARAYELKKEYAKAVAAYKEALTSTVGIEVKNSLKALRDAGRRNG